MKKNERVHIQVFQKFHNNLLHVIESRYNIIHCAKEASSGRERERVFQ